MNTFPKPTNIVADSNATENSLAKKNVLFVYANVMRDFVHRDGDGEELGITNYKDRDENLIQEFLTKLSKKTNLTSIDEHSIRVKKTNHGTFFNKLSSDAIKQYDEVVIIFPTAVYHDGIVAKAQRLHEDATIQKIKDMIGEKIKCETHFTIINSDNSKPHNDDDNVKFLKRTPDKVNFDHIKDCNYAYPSLPCGKTQLDHVVDEITNRGSSIVLQ